ncbi:MAG: hypothetical protein AAGA91_16295 [Pseudomonadota bacterium]
MRSLKRLAILIVLTGLAAGCATNQPPAETPDGLVRDTSIKQAEVYKRPGASLAGYDEYGLVPCTVAFRRNWMRDQNMDRLDLTNRVTQQDVDRIKDQLAAECDKYFKDALEAPPPYKLVESFNDGEKVLILEPQIINLDIAAPDLMSPGMSRTYTTSAGQMTLLLDIIDGTTNETLYRVIDRRRALDTGTLQWTNSVTNKADADRALRYWSSQLRKALDAAHGKQ